MITRIEAGKAVGGNIGTGRLVWRRALGTAFGAAVGIALLASVAVSQYFSADSAPTAASTVNFGGELQRELAWIDARDAAPPAPALPAAQGGHQRQLALIEQRDTGLVGVQLTGPRLQERLYQIEVRDYVLATTPGGDRSSQRGPGWFEARDFPPVTPSLTGTGSQQSRLYEIELRDTGQGATGGDSGPCLPLGDPCNR